MRKSTSRLGRLPPEVREEINRKLECGWGYRLIRKWLFEEVAECDLPALGLMKGESFSVAWLRAAKSPEHAYHHCELALGNWFRNQYPQWLKQQVEGDGAIRLVEKVEELSSEANKKELEGSIQGGNAMIRAMLVDAINTVRGGSNGPAGVREAAGGGSPKDIAQLANAWARLNQSNTEVEKLRLKTESMVERAFKHLGKGFGNDPEAMELIRKLKAIDKRLEEEKKAMGKKESG